MTDNKTLTAARAYTARGLGVFPLNAKVPVTPNGVKDATTDTAQIEAWFDHPRNIGIAVPPGFVVVDVDPRNGGDVTLQAWCDEHGTEWYDLASKASTGGGGEHLWFRYSGEKLRKDFNGVDFQRHGKYVVAPPSITTAPYTWVRTLPADIAEVLWLPEWLLEVAQPVERARLDIGRADRAINFMPSGVDDLNDAAHRFTSWETLLSQHGWIHVGTDKWRHPGSDNQFSATITNDCLFVYSPNTPFEVTESGDPHGYTLFHAIAVLKFDGDMKECARALRSAGYLPSDPDPREAAVEMMRALMPDNQAPPTRRVDLEQTEIVGDELTIGGYLDWPESFNAEDDVEQRWLIEPFVALGRSHALYAPAKVGKSLLMLAASAALATGRRFLDMPEHDPCPVMYLDYEMTRDDVVERLITFGYGPNDLEHLHYALLGSGQSLDTPEGAYDVVHDAVLLGVGLVVVDTTARAVSGAENDADTLRAFYRHCGAPLKRLGISVVRLDHAGKDASKGQRGTSAKNDDVDVVWRLSALEAEAYELEATHQRMGWVDRKVSLKLTEDETTGVSTWALRSTNGSTARTYPTGTGDLAAKLDELGAPLDISVRAAKKLLREHGLSFTNAAGEAAPKFRLDAQEKYLYDSAKRADEKVSEGRDAGRDADAVKLITGRFRDTTGTDD